MPRPSKHKHFAHLFTPVAIGVASGLSLLLFLSLWTPVVAEVSASDEAVALASTSDLTLEISLTDKIAFDITPGSADVTKTGVATLTVKTENSDGYEVHILANNDGALVNSADDTQKINSTSTTATVANLSPNTWGYYFGASDPTTNTTYEQLPTASTSVANADSSSTHSASSTYRLGIGLKVSRNLTAGMYSGVMTVSVTATPREPLSLLELTYMQDMTPEICANSAENDTKRLIDKRDGQYYWTAKLADGNCWMTQNLDLDIAAVKPLTPATSDISANDWDPDIVTLTTASDGSRNDQSAVQYWDLGNYVPKRVEQTSNGCYSSSNFSTCTTYLANVDGMEAMTEIDETHSIIKDNKYDAHYAFGKYYSYNAATAGSGVGLMDEVATDSICPAGWKLPLSKSTNDEISGSFYYLLDKYYLSETALPGRQNIAKYPLYFLRGGHVSPRQNTSGAGQSGRYWSSVASGNADYAYNLSFTDSDYAPARDWQYRYLGFSVRCVAASS